MHLYESMRKFGLSSFSIQIIDTASSKQELDAKEKKWIEFYKSTDPEYGYNNTIGGDSNPMESDIVCKKHDEKMRSDEIRKKISESMKRVRSE